MNDMLIYDFIDDTESQTKSPRRGGEVTGWELVIFELTEDDDD